MSNILPTIGRSVQYLDRGANPTAAIITYVNPNGTVDITVFYRDGTTGTKGNVKLFNPNERANQFEVVALTWQGR